MADIFNLNNNQVATVVNAAMTQSTGTSTHVVHVGNYGYSGHGNASYAFCVPVCFRTMEA